MMTEEEPFLTVERGGKLIVDGISVKELPAGVYVLTARQNQQVIARQKLVIQH